MTTSLVRKVSELGWRNGSSIIRYSENPDVLRKILSEGLFEALSLYSDVKPEAVNLMMSSILEDYSFEPVEIITEAIKDIAGGKKKIYGRVTPNDIREVIQEKLEFVALERERKHNNNKGYGAEEARSSDEDAGKSTGDKMRDQIWKVKR